jgi:hypothetical protein
MNNELVALKRLYEDEQMSPDEIAEQRSLDVVAVKSALMQCSGKYRKDCGREDEVLEHLNFSDEQLERVNEVIFDLALSAEDPHLRFKAATYVRDDKKGRKEVVKNVSGHQFNIFEFNTKLQSARAAVEDIKRKALGEPINV